MKPRRRPETRRADEQLRNSVPIQAPELEPELETSSEPSLPASRSSSNYDVFVDEDSGLFSQSPMSLDTSIFSLGTPEDHSSDEDYEDY
jgi:hypothetical protein